MNAHHAEFTTMTQPGCGYRSQYHFKTMERLLSNQSKCYPTATYGTEEEVKRLMHDSLNNEGLLDVLFEHEGIDSVLKKLHETWHSCSDFLRYSLPQMPGYMTL